MRRMALGSTRQRLIVITSTALIIFLIGYLGWAFYTTSIRYTNVVRISERRAHTIVGKEGYEYIFDPFTHVYIDRIKPNGRAIISYIVLKNYLPSLSGSECTFPDSEICRWISINLHFGPDQRTELGKMIFYSSILGLVSAGGIYLLMRQSKDMGN